MTSHVNVHCTELILIQSLDFNFFIQSYMQSHHVTKIKLFVWLISTCMWVCIVWCVSIFVGIGYWVLQIEPVYLKMWISRL